MEDMELTLDDGESMKVFAYIKINGRNVQRMVYISKRDNQLSISVPDIGGMKDEACILVSADGIKIEGRK